MAILLNKAKCAECGDVVESKHRHDFVWCKCGAIAVDGGKDYLRRVGNPGDCIELSLFEEEPPFGIDHGTVGMAFQDLSGKGSDPTVDGEENRPI